VTRRLLAVGWHNLAPTAHYPLGPGALAGFRVQLDTLARWGTVVPLELVANALAGRANLPPRAVVLTFDDGYADNLDVAAPELVRRGLPATFFVVPRFVRGELSPPWEAEPVRMLDTGEVRELAAMGFEIGSHTCSHPRLSDLGPQEVRKELAESRADVEELVGRSVRFLAYPFGARGDYSGDTQCAAAAAGYHLALTSRPGWNRHDQSPLALRRFFLDPHRGNHAFDTMAAHARGVTLRRLRVRPEAHSAEADMTTLVRCSLAAEQQSTTHERASRVDLSVVVPVHNGADTLGAQLEALVDQEWSGEWDIVVVDNGSTDASAAVVAEWQLRSPRLRLVRASFSSGAGYARTVGVAASDAASFAFCDADDVVAPGWVAAMGDALMQHDFVTGPEDTTLLNPPAVAKHRGSVGTATYQVLGGVMPFAPGCNFGLTRDALQRIGSMSFRRSPSEDVETSYLLWRAGVSLAWVDAALVHYRFRTTRRERWRQAVAYGEGDVSTNTLLRASGIHPAQRGESCRSLVWLLRMAPRLGDPAVAERWLYTLGYRYGIVRGTVRRRQS
jgi:peptidoglycan/xylan/chitin deacetylase (PgdA/CDA1 family)/GT2 family glycosyltransferase